MFDIAGDKICVLFFSGFHHHFIEHNVFRVDRQLFDRICIYEHAPIDQAVDHDLHSFTIKAKFGAA